MAVPRYVRIDIVKNAEDPVANRIAKMVKLRVVDWLLEWCWNEERVEVIGVSWSGC